MSTILSIADFRRRDSIAARVRNTSPFCGPCYDALGHICDLIPHKVWGSGIAYSCPNCGEEFAE